MALAWAWGLSGPALDPLEGEGPGGATRLSDLSFVDGVLGDRFSSVFYPFSFSLGLSCEG